MDPRWLYELQQDIAQARLADDVAGLADVEFRIARRLTVALENERE